MKVTQKLFVFALIFSLIFTVGAAVAAEDMTLDQSELEAVSTETEEVISQETLTESEGEKISNSPIGEGETQLLGEGTSRTVDGTDFKNITTAINSAQAGDTIYLGGKTYNGTQQITIAATKNNLTIIGGSQDSPDDIATLDGTGVAKIMTIAASNVVIKGIKFINVKNTATSTANWGAAITWNGANGTLKNSEFNNNSAASGGAIYWKGENGTIMDSKFTNNYANVTNSDCGAVRWEGANGKIIHSTFENNTALRHAGAVYWMGTNGIIKDSTFTNNFARTGSGGSIFFHGYSSNASIFNSIFTENRAHGEGGAIYWDSTNGTLTESNFIKNLAGSSGGAIYANWGNPGENFRVTRSNFTNNSAINYAGAIVIVNNFNASVSECNFENNTANNGGAIAWMEHNGKITKSTFKGNIATNVGGALHVRADADNFTAQDLIFENNIAASHSGAALSESNNALFNNCNFTNNSAYNVGALYMNKGSIRTGFNYTYTGYNSTVINCNFINNTARNANEGAIYWYGDNGTLKNSNFINNYAKGSGGAVHMKSINGFASDCTFINNTADGNSGALTWTAVNGTLTNCVFENNTANSYSGALHWGASNGNISNVNFTNSKSLSSSNGALGISSGAANVTLKNANFISNYAKGDGGALKWDGANGTATDLTFFSNTAGTSGGAVRWNGANGTLDNSDFINNNATSAGAVSWVGANATMTNSEFINNNASKSQGAVAFSSVNGVLTNCNFTGNLAITGHNGAVMVGSANTTVSDCIFNNNGAVSQGALGLGSGAVNSTISGCTFENNMASQDQGAVVVDAANVTMKDSTFNNNWANYTGGAISWRAANGTLTNTSFTKNNASNGGAVYWSGANGTVSGATFTNNHAVDGGVTDWAGVNGTLKDSKFIGNSANNTGGASHWSGANGTISNCEYTNNSAKIGGAIHSIADGLKVDGNTFKDNDAVYAGSDLSVDGPNTNLVNNKINNSASNASSVYVTDSANFTESGNTYTDPSKSVDYASMIIEVADSFVGHVDKTLTIPVYVHDANGIPALGQIQLFGYGINHLTDGRTSFTIAMPKFQTTMYLTMAYEDGTYKNFMVDVADTKSPIEEAIQPDNGRDELVLHFPKDATGNVTVTINGKNYTSNVVDGFAVIEVNDIPNGNYQATVHYSGDANYLSITRTMNFTVKNSKVNPATKILSNSDVTVIYSGNAYYRFFVTKDGKAVGAGESVTINFNGKNTVVKTDAKGYINYKIPSAIKPKTYAIKATYYGSTATNKVKVTQVIKASNKKVKKSAKVTKVKITLKKVNGKYLKSKKIKIKFNKKTYKVKTNKKGVATWKVKKSMLKKLKVGKKVKYTVTYGKATLSKKLTIKK